MERCENCKYIRRLQHNFLPEIGFEETFCCVVFVHEPDGFMVEVTKSDRCEMFAERGENEKTDRT